MAETFSFFDTALRAYRAKHLTTLIAPQRLLARIIQDTELRFPHRKILETLICQWDPGKALFKELHFSLLVRHARVGKQAAKQHLTLLVSKRYVLQRTDGYRVLYKINEALAGLQPSCQ